MTIDSAASEKACLRADVQPYQSTYDRRLIPHVIDEVARVDPGKVFASIPISTDIPDGFRDITYIKIAQAIDRVALWLEINLGRGQDQPLAYLASSDLRFVLLAVAAVKVGYKMFFLSPRNSLEGQLHLLESVQCKTFICPSNRPHGADAILQQRSMQLLEASELQDWLEGPIAPRRTFERLYDDIKSKAFVMLHSSGSTGLPKAIGVTYGCYAATENLLCVSPYETGYTIPQRAVQGGRLFNGFPLFHAGGLFFALAFNVFSGVPSILPPSDRPLNVDMVDEIFQYGDVKSSCLPPTILTDISKNSSYLERLQHQRFIVTGGAPLSKPIGDVINSRTRIHNWVATTETGNLQQLEVPQKDWEYVSFGPHSGAEFRPHSGDLRELVVVRNQMLEHYQGVFHNFPNLQEYPTNDIYSQHSDPQKSDLWLYRGRADDVIVFSNGEKMNPISMELTIGSDPEVRSALVLGQDRFQAALLIEPEDSLGEEERYGLIERLWPKIQQANEHCPAHGRLSKSHVMLTSKSMVRTDKGSVNRNATAKIYLEELDSLYREQPDKNADSRAHSPLRQTIAESTLLDINQIQDDDNLFTHGMDSLHVIRLARELSTNEKQIEPGTFYRNPTISKLASALQSEDTPPSVRIPKMDAMLQKYSMNLPKRKPRIAMLTGVTGSIGKYLLRDLVNSGQFSKIYCLCRTLQPSTPDVTFLQCDFSDPLLGLPYDIYTELLSSVTDILHSAWQVDFNLPLENFEPHVRGVRHFIDFSSRSKNRAHIFFISSVGSIMNSTSDIVEEQIFDDCSIAQPMGYGESKYIAERLLYLAGIESNVSSTICRVGQIAGPLDDSGMWKKCEWIPSIIATSKFLGCIPASLGPSERITWIPVDKFSQIVMELFTSEVKETTEVLHLINPSATTWTELVPVVQSNLGSDIKVVPLPEWVHALQESVSNVENPDWNPAAKFTDLLQSLVQEQTRKFPILDTTNAVRQSQSLRELGAIRSEWMTHWIKQWAF